MKQRLFCVPCGAHAFDYDGDVHDGALQSEKATLPDGTKPVTGSEMKLPCGHVVYLPFRDLRVEDLPSPELQQLSLPLPGSSS